MSRRCPIKTTAWIVAALLAGMVLGSWGPRLDLRKARTELESLREQLRRREARRGEVAGIASMLRIPESDTTRRRAPSRPRPAVETNAAAPAEAAPVAAVPAPSGTDTNRPARPRSRPIRERIEVASDAWKVRSELARNAFVSNVATDAGDAARFDVLMAAMNLRLSNSVRTWVDSLKTKEDFVPEDGVRILNELSGVLVLTYDELDRTLPVDWRAKAGAQFQVFDFINPAVVLPLEEVEGAIDAGMRTSRPPRLGSPGTAP